MKRFLCSLIFGHNRMRVVQEFGESQRRIFCDRCKGDWGMHDGMRAVVPWDAEIEEMYRTFGYYILKP